MCMIVFTLVKNFVHFAYLNIFVTMVTSYYMCTSTQSYDHRPLVFRDNFTKISGDVYPYKPNFLLDSVLLPHPTENDSFASINSNELCAYMNYVPKYLTTTTTIPRIV